ncbi:LysR family transcriptional regulator [Streptomyces sp. GbtcB7]|uniref:LysR family transcriptional regulator n=1 Tax=Streptomyces sp. GbtcB7 TaxID=2824752 RepID=UPI001C301025|nr:LysR substrate-binding domain-containing protein [Streptomyces sp. GbtcB7]
MNDLEVRELRYFTAVAEELNFTRAAERLGIAQPPLSRAIAALERKLGVSLLVRTTRQVELTSAGRVLLAQARPALEAMAAAAHRTVRAGRSGGPRLCVAVKPGSHAGMLSPIIAAYEHDGRWPPVEVLISRWGDQEAMVRDGRADVTLLRELMDSTGLDSELLLTEPRHAVLPRGHRLAGRSRLMRSELDGETVPVWQGADAAHAAYFAALDHLPVPGPLPPAGPEITDVTQLLEVVAFGMGVAFLPASAAELFPHDGVVHIPVADISPSRLVVTWPRASRSRAVAAFVRAATEVAESAPLALVALA